MATCAYCLVDSTRRLTREHVIPASLNEYAVGRKTFSARAAKFFYGDLTIKDVCAGCNNGVLSNLDAAVLRGVGPHLETWFRTEPGALSMDIPATALARWTLKVCFNMARSTESTDLAALRSKRRFILQGSPIPKGLELYVGRVRSHSITEEFQRHHGLHEPWLDPEMHRISVWGDPRIQRHCSLARGVFLDSIGILVVKRRREGSANALRKLVQATLGYKLVPWGASIVPVEPSSIDTLSSYEASISYHIDAYAPDMPDEVRRAIRTRLEHALSEAEYA